MQYRILLKSGLFCTGFPRYLLTFYLSLKIAVHKEHILQLLICLYLNANQIFFIVYGNSQIRQMPRETCILKFPILAFFLTFLSLIVKVEKLEIN